MRTRTSRLYPARRAATAASSSSSLACAACRSPARMASRNAVRSNVVPSAWYKAWRLVLVRVGRGRQILLGDDGCGPTRALRFERSNPFSRSIYLASRIYSVFGSWQLGFARFLPSPRAEHRHDARRRIGFFHSPRTRAPVGSIDAAPRCARSPSFHRCACGPSTPFHQLPRVHAEPRRMRAEGMAEHVPSAIGKPGVIAHAIRRV